MEKNNYKEYKYISFYYDFCSFILNFDKDNISLHRMKLANNSNSKLYLL